MAGQTTSAATAPGVPRIISALLSRAILKSDCCAKASTAGKSVANFSRASNLTLTPTAFSTWFRAQLTKAQQAQPDNANRLRGVERKIASLVEAIADGDMRKDKSLANKRRELEDERD